MDGADCVLSCLALLQLEKARAPWGCWIRESNAMSLSSKPTCRIVRPGSTYAGKQGLSYFEGIAAETVGSKGICMHLLTIPPGARAKAHLHASHETAIYAISGETHCWFGDELEEHVIVREGEMFYIPAGVPHLPANLSDRPATAVIARTDPNEQESVVLLPDLERYVPR
jgi:uncharacterized RmlC-like cupin family protein